MKLIATTLSVNSEKKTEKFNSTENEENWMGIQSHIDGPRTMTLSVSIEFTVLGNMHPYWGMEKPDRDSAIAGAIWNQLSMFEI